MLDRSVHKPSVAGTVGWAGSTFGPLTKIRIGEHEFEALMRTMDNLGYRTGYAYRFPVLLERSRTRRDVEVPATATAHHQFDDDGVHPALRQHPFAQRQQQERTRWLNTPNSYQKVNQELNSPGQRTTWLKSEEITQSGSTAIKMETNQFVPLFTNPQEVIATRNKIREQNRQDMKTAGPQSQVLASVITVDGPPSPVDTPKVPPEPEPPNPFNQLTDQELDEYRKEVQKKQDGGTNESPPPLSAEEAKPEPPAIQNGGEEEKQTTEELEKGMKALSTNDTTSTPAAPPPKPQGGTPECSPSKSPSKKKKKFKPPSTWAGAGVGLLQDEAAKFYLRSKKRRRSRSTSRDRERRRREKERSRSRDRERRRSRSRSPHRRRSRSPPRRHRSTSSERRDEDSKEPKEKAAKPILISEEDMEGKTEEEIEMMKLMGFGSFNSTKGKKTDGSVNAFAVNTSMKRKYRQYMNRKGGFNRPLDFIA
ncbi:hypothetical protein JOQ06_011509 [Pogonophryne albipinna]|uniref:U4/U6.U5 small nuclear ribonucleoprotein 27kDa protein domain-containing protein n=1 Tax=Pogonophryne albipinna TaxID=1090488 RepID=A0AAD6FPY1_9TELE|nr:hypothetical protein JOQ06_011509 [Pogonophryne albipinna]